jgi:predicted transcriptional regulator
MMMRNPVVLGDLELALMDCLWTNGECDVKDTHKLVGRPRGITLNTTQSTLQRLHKKGLLNREKISHAFVYSPAVARDEFNRDAVRSVVETYMHGEPESMLTTFVDIAESVSPELLDRFEAIIAERLQKNSDR